MLKVNEHFIALFFVRKVLFSSANTFDQINTTADSQILITQQSKVDGKGQISKQSSTTPDPGKQMGKLQKYKKTSHTREPRGQSFPIFALKDVHAQINTHRQISVPNMTNVLCQLSEKYKPLTTHWKLL